MPLQRLGVTARYADIVTHNGTLYTVEVPTSENGDIHTQINELLTSLEGLLTRGGSSKGQLLMATIYLVDMADYDALNQAWEAWLPPGAAPCRACVQVARLAKPGWRVEIAVTAACQG
ncbi:MAG: RidA family protein [Rhodocyclaceae bacterium]|jgi:enamine deaminase RidA (YjgF/YER057c/UK114 family)|nr:RidA family protein [Rhodocyclaceae bacterium]